MTEHDASPQQTLAAWPPGHDTHSSPPTSLATRDIRERHVTSGSPESGESSRFGSFSNGNWATDTDATLAQRLSRDDTPPHDDSLGHRHAQEHGTKETKRSSHHHRSHKHKSAGAFLLADPFEEAVADETRGRKQRTQRIGDKNKAISTRRSRDPPHTTRQTGLGLSPDLKKMGNGSGGQSLGTPPRGLGAERRQQDLFPASPGNPSPQSSHSSVDMDSTKIVSMALNLSESRRLVQRRIASQPIPPRLAPLPTDSNVAGALRQQLQQQRRVSRTVSPKPDHGAGQRVVSNGKTNGLLQPPFEPMSNEGNYRYNFSNSTMSRAQKAKDYMELLAQYRRVIELLPPLKPNSLSKASTSDASSLSMPMSLDSINMTGKIGRPYDPLQYIRNRKVRARERKAIDGQSQGFGDVNRVTDWVDEVAKWVATRQMRTPGGSALPPFSGADMFSMDNSPPTHISRPPMPIVKPKRPRNDWIIEPADLLADIYWLEQDDHKKLIEDRNWRRVFPQDSELYRPLSRATDDTSYGVASASSAHQPAAEADNVFRKMAGDAKAQKHENNHTPSSTREKARHKFQGFRGFHRPTLHDSKHGQSRSRARRDSTSSSSSSESEKRSGREASGDTEKDILEKQMLEMMAREAREAGENELTTSRDPSLKQLKTRPSYIISPPDSASVSRQPSCRESQIDVSDFDDKNSARRPRLESPKRPSRESLEVPVVRGRMSIGSESSAPNSPEYRASRRDNYFMPGIGADLSPSSSRPGSPSRNPLHIVKQIFRDRSRERATERHQETLPSEKEVFSDILKPTSGLTSTPDLAHEKTGSHSRTNSIGSDVKLASRTTGESHKSHRKTNSIRLGDPGAGLRSLFKGPRIDSVLKSGVSKVSELLWKKDSEAEDSDSSTSLSDESDEDVRGRRKDTKYLSPASSIKGRTQGKQVKHAHDILPSFVSISGHEGIHSRSDSAVGIPLSSPTSRRSTRFELLRPPRIDISGAADSSGDTNSGQEADVPDADARLGSIQEGAKNEDIPPSLVIRPESSRRVSAESVRSSRHFSMTEKDLAPSERAPVSRREVARLRAMVLSSGVMAMEISRRAHQSTTLTANTANENNDVLAALGSKVSWPEIVQLAPEDECSQLLSGPVSQANLFPLTARILGTAIQTSRQGWQAEAESFQQRTHAELINGLIELLRARIQLDLSAMTRAAAEEADEVGGDLVDGQRRQVKVVVDVIDKLLRRRRRRFRWVRRAGWLALEWLLVGFMWYVWFVVMIARVFLGLGKGFVRGVRWLLWL